MKAENGSQPPLGADALAQAIGEFGGTLALAGVERGQAGRRQHQRLRGT